MLTPRLAAIRDRMSRGATLDSTFDHRAVHETKVAADRVFGRGAFLGEVIGPPATAAAARAASR